MGCFSWINSDTKNNILGGETINLLCPNGQILSDKNYNCYGQIFCDNKVYDVYALLSLWNRKEIVENYPLEKAMETLFKKEEKYRNKIKDFYNLTIPTEKFYDDLETTNESLRCISINVNYSSFCFFNCACVQDDDVIDEEGDRPIRTDVDQQTKRTFILFIDTTAKKTIHKT